MNTRYSSEFDVSWTAGTRLERELSGPIAAPFTVLEPATICDFWSTQVDWPMKKAASKKSFQETTTLSELTPILGWSWVRVSELLAEYWNHVPVASAVLETASTTALP